MVKIVKKFSDLCELKKRDCWKVLIVDDEKDVHQITKMVLDDFVFKDKKIDFFSAFSVNEAKEVICQNRDVAVILLDVVMETDHAGLDLIEFIRDDLGLFKPRIILRTGQPGIAPEREIIDKYNIDDYRVKTEMTATKLYTTVRTALKGYHDVNLIESNKKDLEKIITASLDIFKNQSVNRFTEYVLDYLISILFLNDNLKEKNASGFVCMNSGGDLLVTKGVGAFKGTDNRNVMNVVEPELCDKLLGSFEKKINMYEKNHCALCFDNNGKPEILFYVNGFGPFEFLKKEIVEIFYTNVSIAFDNINLTKEITNTQKEIILMLGTVGESRSRETAFHVVRVAEYSKLLALKYGLGEDEAEILRLASPMHDIGKVGILDAILNKPGKLTVDEFEIMKTHSTIGYELLKGSERKILKAAAIVTHEHHEKFNGNGYPLGLKGKNIHIYGRITALADVLDALGSDRCYKKAWEFDKIVDLIRNESGVHFDPDLVKIFLDDLDSFIEIRDNYKDV